MTNDWSDNVASSADDTAEIVTSELRVRSRSVHSFILQIPSNPSTSLQKLLSLNLLVCEYKLSMFVNK